MASFETLVSFIHRGKQYGIGKIKITTCLIAPTFQIQKHSFRYGSLPYYCDYRPNMFCFEKLQQWVSCSLKFSSWENINEFSCCFKISTKITIHSKLSDYGYKQNPRAEVRALYSMFEWYYRWIRSKVGNQCVY